jgi:hypothetical protein
MPGQKAEIVCTESNFKVVRLMRCWQVEVVVV